MAIGLDAQPRTGHRLLGRYGSVEGHGQLALQAFTRHLQDVGEADLPGGQLQVHPGAAMHVQDVALGVDQHARRGGLPEEGPLCQLPQRQLRGEARPGRGLGQGGVNGRHGREKLAEGRPVAAAEVFQALEQLRFAVQHDKEIRLVAHGFRGPQEEHATGVQGVVEQGDELLLQVAVQVDHEVPAADEIELGEGRILDDVVFGEDDRVPDAFVDAVGQAIGLGHEEPRQALPGQIDGDAGRVEARPGRGQGPAVDVCGEDLEGVALFDGLDALLQQDGDGVGFLARGAAGAPDPDHRPCGFVEEELGDAQFLEGLERLCVPEEVGNADQQIPEERLHLRGRPLQELDVALHGMDQMHSHATLDAALEGAGLVLGEIVPRLGPQQDEDLLQGVLQLGRLRERGPGGGVAVGMSGVGHELGGHLPGRQLIIHQARGEGIARHAVELGGLRALGHDHAALALDGPHPQGPIAAGA